MTVRLFGRLNHFFSGCLEFSVTNIFKKTSMKGQALEERAIRSRKLPCVTSRISAHQLDRTSGHVIKT